MPTSMTRTFTPELLGSEVPNKWFLSGFCTWVQQDAELSEAPIRQVICNRLGVHDFILLSCELLATPTRPATTLWMRIERRPSHGGMSVFSSKSQPATDTVHISTSPDVIRSPCGSRDIFIYNPTERPPQVLKLKHITEMYQYFIRRSTKYSILGANCRWLCYTLLECLRACVQCYGGHWMPMSSQPERPIADSQAALEVKNTYLREKHAACCGKDLLQTYTTVGLVAGIVPGIASTLAGSSLNSAPRTSQVFTEPGVIYATAPPISTGQPAAQSILADNRANHPLSERYRQCSLPSSHNQPQLNQNPAPHSVGMRAPVPHCSCSNCQAPSPHHRHLHGDSNYAPHQRTDYWQSSACSSGCHSLHRNTEVAQLRMASLGLSECTGTPNDYGLSSSSRDMRSTGGSCWSCTSCGSPRPTLASITNEQRGSISSQHIPHSFSPYPDARPLPRNGSVRNHGSMDTQGHYPRHSTHSNHTRPTSLYSSPRIPEATPYSHHMNWHVTDRSSPTEVYNPPSNPGPCHCSDCSNPPMRHPELPRVASQPLDRGHAQRPSQDSGRTSYINERPFPLSTPGPPMNEQPRSQLGRNWTQEVWMNHGQEVPMRTESPPPIEATPVAVDNVRQVRYSPVQVKMPEPGDYLP